MNMYNMYCVCFIYHTHYDISYHYYLCSVYCLYVHAQVGLVAVNVIGETASGSREGNVPEGELPKGEVPEESESLNFNRGMPAVVRSILPGYHNNM